MINTISVIIYRSILIILFSASFNQLFGQNYPFPYTYNYPYGIKPASLTANLPSEWTRWKNLFLTQTNSGNGLALAGNNNYRVKYQQASSYTYSASEGVGYGMLLAAYAADRPVFDGLFYFFKSRRNGKGLMWWKVDLNGNCTGGDCNSATDGDLDIAFALILAHCQWGSNGSINYLNESKILLNDLMTWAVDASTGGGRFKAGQSGTFNYPAGSDAGPAYPLATCIASAYLAPAYMPYFAAVTGDNRWNTVRDYCYTFYKDNHHPVSGMYKEFSSEQANTVATFCGAGAGQNNQGNFGSDGVRLLWRAGTDLLWHGNNATTIESYNAVDRISNFIRTSPLINGQPAPLRTNSCIKFDGSGLCGWLANFFVPNCIPGMMATNNPVNQSMLNNFYNYNLNNGMDDWFYSQTLRLIGIFVAHGNFWPPSCVMSQCSTPNLGSDFTFCSTTPPVILSSGLTATTNRTFKWYKDGVLVNGPSSTATTYTITGGGVYKVIVDSTMVSGTCSREDQVTVYANLPAPNLGADQNLCNPSSITLNSNVTGTGINYTWEKNSVAIVGENSSTLTNVRSAGTYSVTVSAAGCTPQSDQITITSSLPVPKDACIASAGVADLAIINPGLGAGPYNWYDAATGGSLVASNTTTFSPNVSNTTTYYVQDMSGVAYTVGKLAPGASTWGVNDFASSDKQMTFTVTQSLTIDKISVYPQASNMNVVIRILNSTGATVLFTKTFSSLGVPGEKILDIGFTAAPGTYRIDAVGTTGGNLTMDNTNGGWPHSNAVITLNGLATWIESNNWYPLFYKWQVSTGTTCSRLPVIAKVGNCSASLPVTWGAFYGIRSAESVILHWSTLSESNSKMHLITRSEDGRNFYKIGEIKSGNHNQNYYSFTDFNTFTEISYYQIIQVDYDGTQSLSTITKVNGNIEVTFYPNPFTNSFVCAFNKPDESSIKIEAYNSKGLLIENIILLDTYGEIILGKEWKAGIYYIIVKGSDWIKSIKIIKE